MQEIPNRTHLDATKSEDENAAIVAHNAEVVNTWRDMLESAQLYIKRVNK